MWVFVINHNVHVPADCMVESSDPGAAAVNVVVVADNATVFVGA